MDFNVTPQSLSQLDKVPLYSFVDALRAQNRMTQADDIGLADLPNLQAHEQAMRPLRQQQMQIGNDTSLAQLPGIRAQSAIQQRNNQMGELTFNDEVKSKLGKFAQEASDQEMKQFENEVQKKMYSSNPQEAAEGRRLYTASKHMAEARQKHLDELEKVREQGNNAARVAQIGADSRKAVADIGAQARSAILKAKTPKDYEQLAATLSQQMLSTNDPELRSELNGQIQFVQQMAERLKPVAPQVNPEKVGNGVLQDARPAQMPTPPGAASQMKTLAEKQFGGYDTQAYEYRIAPDGVIERRKK